MKKNLSRMGLPVGFLVLILLLLIPTPPELSTAGHRMLAILVFSVIIWMTEAVAYPVSAGIIMSLMAFLLGTAPNMVNPSKMLGTSGALKMALGGFSSTALALVGAALLIALFCLIGAFIGGVKDKKKFVESVYLFFQHDENSRY